MHEAGLSTVKSLQSITSLAAGLLNQSENLGQINLGFYGDFIAIRGNPLDDPRNLCEIDLVMQNGQVIENSL